MTKARQLADLGNAYSDGALSNRNLIINGEFLVWQRGTSITSLGTQRYYTADRWQTYGVTSGAAATVSRSTDVPAGQGFLYSAYYDASATTQRTTFTTSVELPEVSNPYPFVAGQRYTLSAWVKTTDADRAKLFTARFGSAVQTGISAMTITEVVGHTGGGGWERVIYHIDITDPVSISGANQLRLYFGDKDGTGSNTTTAYYTGVQLEVGDTATPFEHRSYGQELALCQRYYRQTTNLAYGEGTIYAYNNTGQSCGQTHPHPVVMRTAPTTTFVGTWYQTNCVKYVEAYAESVFHYIGVVSTGPANSRSANSGYITYDAEL